MGFRGWVVGSLAIILLPACWCKAQSLSTVVLPSTDEIYEALLEGEINYEQYEILMELIESGITPESRFLLDEIPNLADFSSAAKGDTSSFGEDQTTSFQQIGREAGSRRVFKHQYYSTLEEPSRERYNSSLTYDLNCRWSVSMSARKELTGRERFISRAITYQTDSSAVRSVTLGSFKTRYGLGSVIGYRGKSLRYESRLSAESFLCPDNGGFNGAAADIKLHELEIRGMCSINRDTAHGIVTSAAMVQRTTGRWSEAVIVGLNGVTDRSTGHRIADFKTALSFSTAYQQGTITAEYCVQTGSKNDFGTVLVEGTHRSQAFSVQYAAWRYGHDYLDIAGGGKGATINHRTTLPEIDFTYSDKRAGQVGVLTKGSRELTRNIKVFGDLLAASRDIDSSLVQFSPGMEWSVTPALTWTLDYLQTVKSRFEDSLFVEPTDRKIRLEARYRTKKTTLRAYAAHSSSATRGDYVTLFASAKKELRSGGVVEAWSNLGRLTKGRVDYWYGYLRVSQPVLPSVDLAVKLNHRYDRKMTRPNETAASLEVVAEL